MSDSFFDGYRHPLWQKKRLRIMERAKWRCEHCGTDSKCLNVHHTYYKPAKEHAQVWEYDDSDLVCLCEDCHDNWHVMMNCLKRKLGKMPYRRLREVDEYIDPRPVGVILNYDGRIDFSALFDDMRKRFHEDGLRSVCETFGLPLPNNDEHLGEDGEPTLF